MNTVVVITAGGTGTRFGATRPKQFLEVAGKMMIEHTIHAFDSHPLISQIVVVLPENEISFFAEERKKKNFGKKIGSVVSGGSTRQESVRNGILAVQNSPKYLAVHDAARCLITEKEITDTIEACEKGWQGAICGLPIRDTIKKVDGERIVSTEPRENLCGMQTPQTFHYQFIKDAYEKAFREKFSATDDAQVAERLNARLCVVQGKTTNIKITYPEDLQIAEMILQHRK